MQLIDTHCHLDIADFDADRSDVLALARRAQVAAIVVPGVVRATWSGLIGLCSAEMDLYPALGLHPVYLEQHQRGDIEALAQWADEHHPVAIGEIGLDYFVAGLDRQRQQQLFEAQLCIARDVGRPVLLHVRKAHDQVLATLKRIKVSGGIAHAFNGSLVQAQRYIELGFSLGFGGMLTYARSRHIRGLARDLPAEAIVLETDAPDLTPAAHHGERNSPAYLPECLQALAEVRGEPAADLASQTTRNACALLDIHVPAAETAVTH